MPLRGGPRRAARPLLQPHPRGGGRTQSRWLGAEQAHLARRQVEAGQRFRAQVEAYWAACEAWADAQLEAPAAAPAAGQKGAHGDLPAETVREVATLLGPGVAATLDFEAVEVACRRQALALAAHLLAEHLNADTSDDIGPWRPCDHCGGQARYAGRHAKTFTTALGPLTLTRAYYHCAACHAGGCPRDQALGLDGGSLSPAVTRMVGTAAALVSFAEGRELLGIRAVGVGYDVSKFRTGRALSTRVR